MSNVLIDELPYEWNGYQINTWFQVGIQVYLIQYDPELSDWEKGRMVISLLFSDEDTGALRNYPHTSSELEKCVDWFLNGWFHDNAPSKVDKRRMVDYEADQWRIYADFRQIYGINLNDADLHWWEFCGMLWNMPYKLSSFLQVIDIRKKKITSKMSREEKASIAEAKRIYAIQQTSGKKEYTSEECKKIDDYDRMMEEIRKRKEEQKEAEQDALAEFRRC